MAARSRSPRKRRTPATAKPAALHTYYDATREPLVCLVFLLPLVAAYELGGLLLRPIANPEEQLVAASTILRALAWFGAAGAWVPGVALLLTLLIWHVASGKSWTIRGWAPLAMIAESIIITPPLLVLRKLMLTAPPAAMSLLSVSPADDAALKVQLVFTLGAAIYEEFLFRFLLISALLLILVDVFRVPRLASQIVAGTLAAVAFAACHFWSSPFDPTRFAFYTLAGGYLSLLYLTRGLGVATGCHAAYNIVTLLWR